MTDVRLLRRVRDRFIEPALIRPQTTDVLAVHGRRVKLATGRQH
jgi:hypothetical protein